MRIALLVTQLEAGGAQRVALDIAEGLRGLGHNVETWFFYEKAPAYSTARNVRVLLPARPRGLWSLAALVRELRAAIRQFDPEATIAFTHYANVLGSIAAAFAGVGCRVVSQQNPAWTYPKLARLADGLVGAIGLYSANIAVSRAVRDSFSSYPSAYRRRVVVVPNGSTMRTSSESRGDARRRFAIPQRDFVALAVGRLHPQKNHSVLFRALEKAPGVHLLIAGDGELRDELEHFADSTGIRDRVRFLGNIPGDDVPALLRAADVFVMPSRFEGLSLALLEALAAGLPIVSSNIAAQVEVLTDLEGRSCAYLLDCDDVEAWAAAMRSLRDHEEYRASFARAAADRAAAFHIATTVRGYEAAVSRSR